MFRKKSDDGKIALRQEGVFDAHVAYSYSNVRLSPISQMLATNCVA